MLRNCKEEDFYKLRMIAVDRLSPDGITVFFWGALVYSGIITLMVNIAVAYEKNAISQFWPVVANLETILFIIQLLIVVLFSFQNIYYKLQKIQTVFATIILLKISMEIYLIYFWARWKWHAPLYMGKIGIYLYVGGLVYLILSLIRGYKRIYKGEFRQGGNGLYKFQNSKAHVSLPVIFGVTMLSGSIVRILSENQSVSGNIITLYLLLFLSVAIQYIFVAVWPEFLFVTYCKFRFESFQIPRPKRPLPTRKSSKQLKSKRHKANSQLNVNKKKHKGGKVAGKK
ncbi:hypothetical protein ACFO4N_11820 [Camelliibacillus cellulosilyticus]|uniref:Uncharacterized protein n=1 Tax=Camelliibacillus cellulosilyticus TaxID=2174486 RepID=A0ABV9GQ22_9BACL